MSTLANLSAHSGKQHAYIVGTFVLLNVLCILTAWFQAIIFEIQCNVFVCEQSNNWRQPDNTHQSNWSYERSTLLFTVSLHRTFWSYVVLTWNSSVSQSLYVWI